MKLRKNSCKMFRVKWHPNTRKFLRKQQKDVSKRIVNKIKSINEKPFRFLEHYEGKGYKLRIGDYRALIDVDTKRKILFIRVLDKTFKLLKTKNGGENLIETAPRF